MNKRTRALDIPKAVKDRVWERDGQRCILCGDPQAMPNAHYISRAQGGLGIEENIVTLCRQCHNDYDNSPQRPLLREEIRAYLQGRYPGWDEASLTYRKDLDHV